MCIGYQELMVKPRSKNEQLPVRRIPVHELFPQPDQGRRAPPKVQPAAIPPLPKAFRREAKPQKSFRKGSVLWGVVFLGLIVSSFGLFGYMRRGEGQLPYVLLDIRALEENGHPVTAADVMVNDKKMGVTDSFGEWRRYLQLNPGDDVQIDLAKNGQLSGSKVALVPKRNSDKQDIELQLSISMKRSQLPAGKAKAIAKDLEENVPPPALPVKEEAPKEAMRVAAMIGQKDARAAKELDAEASRLDADLAEVGDQSLGIYFDDGLNRINVVSALNQLKPTNVMDKHQHGVVRDRVIPVLINDLQNLGLTVDKKAPWKLSLGYVPNGDQVGYIRAEIEWQSPFGQKEKTSFIAGFAKTYDETGRGLTSLLRLHMKKTYWAAKEKGAWVVDETPDTKDFWKLKAGAVVSDTSGEKFALSLVGESQGARRFRLNVGKAQPCEAVRQRSRCMVSTESLKEAPPLPGWVQKRVRILGPVPANADVYVAGFQAHSLGNNQWEFWSKSGSKLKALVLAGGRIIHSEAFKDAPGEALIIKMAAAPRKAKAH